MDTLFTPLDRAKWDTVHHFRGGAERLGPMVGINPKVLCNKVNPSMESHHLTVDEAIRVQIVTKNYQILQAEGAVLNHIVIQALDCESVSDVEPLNLYAEFHAEVGEAAQQLRATLADGRVERAEVEQFRKEMFDVFSAGVALCHRLEALVDG